MPSELCGLFEPCGKTNLGFKNLNMMSWTVFLLDFMFPWIEMLRKGTQEGMFPSRPKYYSTHGSIRSYSQGSESFTRKRTATSNIKSLTSSLLCKKNVFCHE